METNAFENPRPTSVSTDNPQVARDFKAAADKAASAIHNTSRQISDAAAEKMDQAKQKAGDIYDQVNRTVNDQYNRAVDYSRDNPGKTTLIAFGVGVGVGLLLLGNMRRSRPRHQRVVEPVVNALSTLAVELFG